MIDQPNLLLSVCELLSPEQEVLCKQMEVFSLKYSFRGTEGVLWP